MKEVQKILNNQKGVALMMVLASIIFLMAIMSEFSLESHVNKLKGFNIEDRAQAKLTAEAGLKFAMTRLRLYKEAYNFLESNDQAKNFASQKLINNIWSFPFIYPIPVTSKMNQIQKNLIKKFSDSTILKGTMRLTIENISNLINLNLIRVSTIDKARVKSSKPATSDQNKEEDSVEDDADFNAESQLIKILTNSVEAKSDSDELFAAKYLGMDIVPLVNNLKYYVSDPESLESTPVDFEKDGILAKNTPFSSFSEIYNIPGWDDDLVELIMKEFTVHGAIMVDLNKINDSLLKVLLPEIQQEEITEFFKYRDDPENPKFFNQLSEFKDYIVNSANIISSADFDERFNKYQKQGLKFGPSPTLFKINSTAQKGRANFNLVAYVVLPAKPLRVIPPKSKEDSKNESENESESESSDSSSTPKEGSEEKQVSQLLEPRIVEIIIN